LTLLPTVTGGTSGIGKQTALELCKHSPSQLWITGRGIESGVQAVEEIKSAGSKTVDVKFLKLDLSSFESIKTCAQTVVAEAKKLDILMLNAGIVRHSPSLLSLN
jgi:retinol dehydrogenase-12